MFIISAVAGGVSLTLLATIVTSKFRQGELIPEDTKRQVARFIGYTLLIYIYIKLWDWAATSYYSHSPGTTSAIERLQATTPYTTTFWGLEVFLGGLIPAFILLYQPLRRSDRAVITALAFVVLGVVVNRWNVTLSGLVVPPDWSPGVLGNVVAASYFPTLIEILVALGVLAYGLLGFTLGVRLLPIYEKKHAEAVTGD
jgi:molybdopterin-containing oxidoreductase family membrane subunit